MKEIVPGVYHWTAFHPGIRQDVHSYLYAPARVLIDPMIPEGGVEALARYRPERILLTNRHHYRRSDELRERFGCPVLCHEAGLREFAGAPQVRGFAFGDEVALGIDALELDAICPEETALHLRDARALALADSVIRRRDGALAFVSDYLLGDEPERIKADIRAALRRLLEVDFDALLLAHGDPLTSGGKAALAEFAEAPRRQ
jgi:Metallo-beta-lactamase superfamily